MLTSLDAAAVGKVAVLFAFLRQAIGGLDIPRRLDRVIRVTYERTLGLFIRA